MAAQKEKLRVDTLDLGSLARPLTQDSVFRASGYFCWGPNLIKGDDGRYYMAYSRWPSETGAGGWLTDSEIAVAVADRPEGPYEHVQTLLQGRGPGHWDELMAHNPKLKRFGDKYYLYYISSRQGPTRGHVRYSQRTGVTVADSILGPYERFDAPLVEPSPPIYNLSSNPGVTQMHDGRYLLITKGDIEHHEPSDSFPQRIQALGIADSPTGPFELLPEPAIADIDTEDASIWYDAEREVYYAVFHAHEYIGLITSDDGVHWHRAKHYEITRKALACEDGSVLQPGRMERPSVFIEDGVPRVLCLGGAIDQDWFCILLPLG